MLNKNFSDGDRKRLRRRRYDYSQPGYYFVTVLTHNRRNTLGKVIDGIFTPSEIGTIAERCWLALQETYDEFLTLDTYSFMPNHMHGIIFLEEKKRKSLGQLIGAFKATATSEIRRELNLGEDCKIWHRNFHDRIIRSSKELERVRWYIFYNPAKFSLKQKRQ